MWASLSAVPGPPWLTACGDRACRANAGIRECTQLSIAAAMALREGATSQQGEGAAGADPMTFGFGAAPTGALL